MAATPGVLGRTVVAGGQKPVRRRGDAMARIGEANRRSSPGLRPTRDRRNVVPQRFRFRPACDTLDRLGLRTKRRTMSDRLEVWPGVCVDGRSLTEAAVSAQGATDGRHVRKQWPGRAG
jgi:hypothetical protein